MRCREAIRRLNNSNFKQDVELKKHLESCPACAQEAKAAGLLEKSFGAYKDKLRYPASSFDLLRTRIEESDKIKGKERGFMAVVKEQVTKRPVLTAGLGLAITVFLFITLVPFSYTRTVGYEIVYNDVDPDVHQSLDEFGEIVDALGYENISLTEDSLKLYIGNIPDHLVARTIAMAFGAVVGYQYEPDIIPVIEIASGTLYAQVMDSKNRIEVDTQGKTDEEIMNEIKNKLESMGIKSAFVEFETLADGEKRIHIKTSLSDDSMTQESEMEFRFAGDSTSFGFDVSGAPPKIEIDTEGMTDEEVKAAIKAKLAEEGKGDAEVFVTTDSAGKRQIEVRVEKEEMIGD